MSMNHTMADDTFTYDADGYVEQGAEVCPYPGFYLVKPLSVGRAKNRDGEEITRDGWPILRVNRAQIEHEDGSTQKFAVFQDVSTKPTKRPGPGNKQVSASAAVDVLRAIDIDAAKNVSSFEEAYETAEDRLKAGDPFVCYVGLTARDSAYIKAQLEALGPDASQQDKNEVYNKATMRTKDFRNPDGTFRFQVQGPSGATLDAKPTFSKYIASDKRDSVELGPQKASSK